MFVSMILDPIWQLYDAAVRDKNGTKAGRMASKLGLEVPPRELASSDPRTVLQVCRGRGRWERGWGRGRGSLCVVMCLGMMSGCVMVCCDVMCLEMMP